ncbi:c-type cytochrome [Paenalcaligenes hominis]|uniref:c-type cytochrome n=1 Tax=Paenalcaligenes hominis TaxID=643674 RepID=UPI0035261CAE
MSPRSLATLRFNNQQLTAAPQLPATAYFLYGAVIYPAADVLAALTETDPDQSPSVDWTAAQQVPGVVKCIQHHHFLAIVAAQQHAAYQARDRVEVDWGRASNTASWSHNDAYSWDSSVDNTAAWAVAHFVDQQLHLWLSTAYPRQLQSELAVVTGLSPDQILLYQSTTPLTESYDVAVEAALIALEVDQPIYRQAQSQLQVIRLALSDTADTTWQANVHPGLGTSVAARLLGWNAPQPAGVEVRTDYVKTTVANHIEWVAPTGQQADYAAALSFAAESEFDELQRAQGQDPLQARLTQMHDERGKNLIQRAATQAGWVNATGEVYTPQKPDHGYGFAYVKAFDYEQQPAQEVWSAWAVELKYDATEQQLNLNKVTVAFDTDQHSAPIDSAQTQIKHRISQWTQQLLGLAGTKPVSTETSSTEPTSAATDLAHIQVFNQSPVVGQSLAWSKTVELPAAAAIANAVKDATQVRLYHAPLDLTLATQRLTGRQARLNKAKKRWAWAGGMMSALTGALLVAAPWRPAIPPVNQVDTSIFSNQAIERGRLVALAGDCMVCHTTEDGKTNAGGLGLDTPFGTIYTTNITPDKETGIGAWSYKAFERAMRDGIHRDGSHLYPAFPYTSYAQLSDEDLQSLYAYLMVQEPVYAPNKTNELPFPFSFRPALAGWNTLFHKERQAYQYQDDQSQLWNRGAYLVNSSGHCAACHSPRNALGGEKRGQYFLAGGEADGWEAPALNALSKAPVAWTENELYQYLRTGQSTQHGVAAGPMGPIIAGLAELPEYDVRAMSHYLMNIDGQKAAVPATVASGSASVAQVEQTAQTGDVDVWLMPGKTIYEGACAVCHDSQSGPALFGYRPSLALNTNVHSDKPDNLIQVIMHGITRPSASGLGNMPAFKHSLNDSQLVDLLKYLRKQYAPEAPAWANLLEKVQQIRQQPGHL